MPEDDRHRPSTIRWGVFALACGTSFLLYLHRYTWNIVGPRLQADFHVRRGAGRFNDYWGRWTRTGVHGDPTRATAEKGKPLFKAAVNGIVALVDELRAWPIEPRADMHTGPVQSRIRWSFRSGKVRNLRQNPCLSSLTTNEIERLFLILPRSSTTRPDGL
ncbi:MAG: hypothetical protein NVSMB9_35790 [Isosphaeraceae bacterium]